MSMNYNKIAEEIISLYCTNKPNKVPCGSRECEMRRCLCIDEQQIRIISFLAEFPYQITTNGHDMVMITGSERLNENLHCVSQETFLYKLIACKGHDPDRLMQTIQANKEYLSEQNTYKIIRALPQIQTINQSLPVDNRDTLSHFCTYGTDAASFMKGLFSALICQLLNEFIESKSSLALWNAAERIFRKVGEINEKSYKERFLKSLKSNIRIFLEKYDAGGNTLVMLATTLKEYYAETDIALNVLNNNGIEDACSCILETAVSGKDDIIYAYRIFQKLLSIARLRQSTVLDNFFREANRNLDPNPLYERLLTILGRFDSFNPTQMYKVLTAFVEMYSDQTGICDEAVSALEYETTK